MKEATWDLGYHFSSAIERKLEQQLKVRLELTLVCHVVHKRLTTIVHACSGMQVGCCVICQTCVPSSRTVSQSDASSGAVV